MFIHEFTVEVQGKKRTFKLCTLCYGLFSEAEGIELPEVGERLMKPKPFTYVNLFHSAAVAYCRINKLEPDFTFEDVTQWFDEAGEVLMDVFNKSMSTYTQKKISEIKAARKVGKAGKAGMS